MVKESGGMFQALEIAGAKLSLGGLVSEGLIQKIKKSYVWLKGKVLGRWQERRPWKVTGPDYRCCRLS